MTGLWSVVAAPAGLAVASIIGGLIIARRLRPQVSAVLLTIFTVVAAFAMLWGLLIVALANVVQLHGIAELFVWCSDLGRTHIGTPTPVGLVAFGLLVGASIATFRARRLQRSVSAPDGSAPFLVLESDEVMAFARPGRPGQIVVSSGMLGALDEDEQRVLIAHERAHLRLHHHRYVRAAELAASAVPLLRPLTVRVRYATERWADEEAALQIGDRGLVARAIAHAALATTASPTIGLGLADTGTVARVEALLNRAPRRASVAESASMMLVAMALITFVGSVMQVHHWMVYALGFCSI